MGWSQLAVITMPHTFLAIWKAIHTHRKDLAGGGGAEALIHSYLNIRPRAQAENTEKSHTESKICGTTTNA